MKTEQMLRLAELLEKGTGRIEAIDSRLRRLEASRDRLVGLGAGRQGGDQEKRPFSYTGVIRAMANGGLENEKAWKGIERERQIGLAGQARALATDSDPAGGYVVPPQYVAELIPELLSKTVVLESGATQMTGLDSSPVSIPRLEGGATAAWTSENGTISDSDQNFGQVTLAPHQATGMTKMSRRVVAMSNPSIEAIVRNDLSGAVSRLLDLAALRGTGAAGAPMGIASTPGIGGTSWGGAPTIEDLYAALYALEAADAPMESLGWVMNPRTMNTLRLLRSDGGGGAGTGPFMLQPDPTKGVAGTLLGYPVRTTTAVPITLGGGGNTSECYFAAWSELIWALFGGIVIEATKEGGTAFADHQVWVKIVAETDFAVRHAASFYVGTGITT